MASEEENVYAIVLFLPRQESDNLIDLIPSSWISTDANKVLCKYPGPEEYSKLPQWIAALHQPKQSWEQFDVDVLSYACTLKQGRRRLKRACTDLEIRSSSAECNKDPPNARPVILNNSDFEKELENMPIFISSLAINDEVENIAPNTDEGILEKSTSEERTIVNGIEEDSPESPHVDDDLIPVSSKKYLDKQFKTILAAINSAKRSILYDVDNKVNDIKVIIAATNTVPAMQYNDIKEVKSKLGEVAFPITTIADFLLFEEAIETSKEKKKALMDLYRILVYGETCMKKCIKKLMTATITKTVEMEYSAYGRQIHGIGKKNFSKTHTYLSLNDVLLEKFGHTEEYKQLSSILSRPELLTATEAGKTEM